MTKRQRQVYEFIREFTAEHHYSPSVREIAAAMHLSVSTIQHHLDNMKVAGVLASSPGTFRSITLVEQDSKAENEAGALLERISAFFADKNVCQREKDEFYSSVKILYGKQS